MNANAQISILLDVNHVIDILDGHKAPKNTEELLLLDDTAAAVAATEGATLVGSEHCLDLLEYVLQRELGYTEEEAILVADLYYELTVRTDGEWVTVEEGRLASSHIAPMLPSGLIGPGKGQVDDEDLQVLGAAAAVAHEGRPAVIVTRDGGIHNVGNSIAHQSVLAMHKGRLKTVLAAIRRTR